MCYSEFNDGTKRDIRPAFSFCPEVVLPNSFSCEEPAFARRFSFRTPLGVRNLLLVYPFGKKISASFFNALFNEPMSQWANEPILIAQSLNHPIVRRPSAQLIS